MGRPRLAPGETGQPWTVELTGGGHRAVVRVRDRDGRVREVSASHTTKSGALRALQRKLESRLPPTAVGVQPSTTLSELGTIWLQHRTQTGHARRRTPLRAQTLAAYADQHRIIIEPHMGGLRVGEASVGLVEGLLTELDSTGISTAGARSVLRQMFAYAERHGAISTNPMRLVAPPARGDREVDALDLDAVHRLRALVDPATIRRPGKRGPNPDLADFIDVALGTGARIGEILALRRVDFTDAEAPLIRVCGTLVEPRGEFVANLHRQDSTKSRADRTLVLPEAAATVIRRRLQQADPMDREAAVFASRNGTWLWPNNLRTRLRTALAGVQGLEGTTPHTLRRTVGTLIAHEAGLDAAREQLGHSDPSLTFQAYVARRTQAPDLRHILDGLFTVPGKYE